MRPFLIVLAVLAGAVAAVLGFGHAPEHAEDIIGWLALSVTLYVAASLPFDRFDR